MKTVSQYIRDEIYYPIPMGTIENCLLARGLSTGDIVTTDVLQSKDFKGALADCLFSLIQAVTISEADKTISGLTDAQRKAILSWANKLYNEIGEEPKGDLLVPTVTIVH